VLYLLMKGERYLKRALRKGKVTIAKLKPYLIRTPVRPDSDNA
jgi:hypothetical protein